MNVEFEAFKAEQDRIYAKFASGPETARAEGLKATPYAGKGAYLIVFRHSPRINELCYRASKGYDSIVPGTIYAPESIHTTITDHDLGHEFTPEKDVLEKLTRAMHGTLKRIDGKFTIDYTGWLMNQDTLLAKGYPAEQFHSISRAYIEEAKKEGLDLRMPWGAHITVARSRQITPPGESVDELVEYVRNLEQLGISEVQSVLVGHSAFSEDAKTFKLTPYEEFVLADGG